jgi:hypothetical protein
MENRRSQMSRPRLLCRGRRAPLALAALLSGCTTTHTLGRLGDPGVREEVDAVAARGDATLQVRPPPGVRMPRFGYSVTGVLPNALVIESRRGQSVLVPREQVASISTYPRARGARDGAIAGGLVGFTVGFTFGILLGALTSTSEGGERPDPAIVGLKVGGGLGAIVALLGAGLGALAGHEERFDLAP